MATRRKTVTSNFGVGGRESHDSTAFYGRFTTPKVSTDQTVVAPFVVTEPFVCGDSARMDTVPDGSVALVVTSPPYFAGKQYEEELERDGVPSSYVEYLEMLAAVFAECERKLEPGGRIAVNVANLGRKPYRSLSADVIHILQELGLLLRGELVWQKGEGASGSCAWGSFRSASNPVLRDITERVIIASKGRFDRARTVKQRAAEGLPHVSTVMTEDFLGLTLDVWNIPPESARRVGHPAPFPVELPEQLIRLYTFENDLILDPFMGSGSSLVAAARLDRRYVGYDLDPAYVGIARRRVEEEALTPATAVDPSAQSARVDTDVGPGIDEVERRAAKEGKAAQKLALDVLEAAGFTIEDTNRRIRRTGVVINFVATDKGGATWFFDVAGPFTTHRGGMLKTDTVWKSLGRAYALRQALHEGAHIPLVFLTSHLPRRSSEGDVALRAAGTTAFFDAVAMLSAPDLDRLASYGEGGRAEAATAGFWTQVELERRVC